MPVIDRITCSDCGKELIISEMHLDTWGDLMVEVESCPICNNEAYEEEMRDEKEKEIE